MRTDHYAYKRASKVALIGFLFQVFLVVILLFFGLQQSTADTGIAYLGVFAAVGLLGWVGLAVVFYQHRLERLENLEEEELTDRSAAIFATDLVRPAARRLQIIYRYFLPAVSVIMAIIFVGISLFMFSANNQRQNEIDLPINLMPSPGWGIAGTILLGLACFIFSRFIAGMSKVDAWANLRSGSGFMVANALLLGTAAVGMGFRFFDNQLVSESLTIVIPSFGIVFASEIVLNLILNLYRPRIPGEVPRPAFDSKLLSLFAAPDNLVKSANEAINYQFGFDVTSTWGYQLLIKRGLTLCLTGISVLILLSCLVIVNPNQQGVVLRFGEIQGEGNDRVINSGPLFKLPWPIETVILEDVTTIRKLPITFRYKTGVPSVSLWANELSKKTRETPEPFLVSMRPVKGRLSENANQKVDMGLIDIQVDMHYSIDIENAGLIQWLNFANNNYDRRLDFTYKELALRSIAQQVLTQALLVKDIDLLLSNERSSLAFNLESSLQKAFDIRNIGIKVLDVSVPQIRPAGDVAGQFEEVGISRQDSTIRVAQAKQRSDFAKALLVGEGSMTNELSVMLDQLQSLRRNEISTTSQNGIILKIKDLEQRIENVLLKGQGQMGMELLLARSQAIVETLRARARATRVSAQAIPYEAAPELFRQRAIMLMESSRLRSLRKYLLVADPSRVSINMELQEVNPLLNFGETLTEEDEDF